MHGHRRLPVILIVLAMASVGWTPQQGSFSEPFGGSGGRVSAEGVHEAGGPVRWSVDTAFVDAAANGAVGTSSLLLTDTLLLMAVTDGTSPLRYQLVARNLSDGAVAWTSSTDLANGIKSGCTAVDAQTGAIWTIAEADGGSNFLIELDPVTGEEVVASRIDILPDCDSGLHLLPDGLIAFQDFCCDDALMVLDTVAGAEKARYSPGSAIIDDLLLTSPDGSRMYTMLNDDGTGPNLQLVSAAVATGAEIDTLDMPGTINRFRTMQQAYVDRDGGIVIVTEESSEDAWINRVIDDGTGVLSLDWSVQAFERDGFAGEGGPGFAGEGGSTFAGTGTDDFLSAPSGILPGGPDGSLIIAKQSNLADGFVALNLEDGSLAWTADIDSGTVEDEDWLVDANGNAVAIYEIGRRTEGTNRVPYDVFSGVDGSLLGSGPLNLAPSLEGAALGDDGTLYLLNGSGDDQTLFAVEAGTPGAFPPGVSRLDAGEGASARQIAIRICQALFPTADTADRLILAREDVFADALAGAPLAGDDACILFTPRDELDPEVAAEIDRVLTDGATVQILGGEAAVSAEVGGALTAAGYAIERFAGDSRYQTAKLVAEAVREANPGGTAAMLAFAGNWPDAVTGGAYGAFAGVPILLTDRDSVSPATQQAIDELGVETTYVLGGPAVIAEEVRAAVPGGVRVAGGNRMATAVATATDLWLPDIETIETFVVVNLERGDAWNLALAAAPLSARFSAPQLGVSVDRYPDETRVFLQEQGFTELPAAVLIGDVSYIGAEAEDGVATTLEE